MKNKSKKLILGIFFVMLMMSVMCFGASAETVTGECGLEGDNLIWSFDTETGVLTIDGEGEMDNYLLYNNINMTSAPWWEYHLQIKELVLGDEVTSIGDYAFYKATNLTGLQIPGKIKTIGSYAFYECDGIKDIIIPDNVTSIGSDVFSQCYSLESLKIGNGLTEISKRAFYNCLNLVNIEWGTNLKNISGYAFYRCSYNGGDIVIPGGVTTIDEKAFYTDAVFIDSISIPLSVKKIGSGAFDISRVVSDVYYEGTIEQWEEITVYGNGSLRDATFHFGHAHSYASEITTAPSCLTTGLKIYTCECGGTYTRELSALGHDIIVDSAVSATCTETGLTEGEHCTRCDYKVEQEEIPSLGHDMINLEASEPTCTETGLTAGVACSRCDEIFEGRQEAVPSLGHNIVIDSAVSATCAETGLTQGEHCTRCDYKIEQEETPALGHKETFTEYVEATCTETGLSVGKKCLSCGEVFVPAQIIPAKGHNLSKWIVTSEETCNANGKRIKLCSCGLTEEEIIAATGHADADADGKCDNCSVSLTEDTEQPKKEANVFSFLTEFLNNIIDFFRKLFGIR